MPEDVSVIRSVPISSVCWNHPAPTAEEAHQMFSFICRALPYLPISQEKRSPHHLWYIYSAVPRRLKRPGMQSRLFKNTVSHFNMRNICLKSSILQTRERRNKKENRNKQELRKMFKAAKPIKTCVNFPLGEVPVYRGLPLPSEALWSGHQWLGFQAEARAWEVRMSAFWGVSEVQGKKNTRKYTSHICQCDPLPNTWWQFLPKNHVFSQWGRSLLSFNPVTG